MRKSLKLACFWFLVVSMIICNFLPVNADSPGTVSIAFDRQDANVGDIITASVNIADIPEFAGIQFNLKYDPAVLQAVDPVTGQPYPSKVNGIVNFNNQLRSDILLNDAYIPYEYIDINSVNGTFNGTRGYIIINDYRQTGIAETQGTVARIGFKVLSHETTSICFEGCVTMPRANCGTLVANWYGQMISDYVVNQPDSIM